MRTAVHHEVLHQFLKFGVVGLLSAGIDWGIYYVLTRHFGVFYLTAKVISFVVSAVNSYIWNRRWTFRSDNPNQATEFTKFFVVALIGMGLNALLMLLIVGRMKQRDIVGLVLATGVVAIWNFVVNRLWTFRKQGAGDRV